MAINFSNQIMTLKQLYISQHIKLKFKIKMDKNKSYLINKDNFSVFFGCFFLFSVFLSLFVFLFCFVHFNTRITRAMCSVSVCLSTYQIQIVCTLFQPLQRYCCHRREVQTVNSSDNVPPESHVAFLNHATCWVLR